MSPSQQQNSTNPSNLKNQFAHRFVRALNNLNHTKPSSPHDHNHIYKRCNHVKVAAYTAMASVVGSRRAWSRSVLLKIRKRSRNRKRRVDHAKVCLKKKSLYNTKIRSEDFNPFTNPSQESKLRKLVPGSETMDSWCLMGETADYIKCLVAQVEVMKTLVDLYATS
ncbi:hypothetical protein QVD17_17358 [Tagetes erecta]|uniref:IBH1-like N-terminal domain-containing protein n=1 Tax=Tagetes erecta TaxID=13708 RepID=A0AAD8P090_TARER|nr:hypothetical protein QVD17_17358 [Tagetes erecta]